MELGVSVREIEEEMSISEYKEYQMYFQQNPFQSDIAEIQMAQLMTMASSYMGGKHKADDFMVGNKFKIKRAASSVGEMSAEQINQMAGV